VAVGYVIGFAVLLFTLGWHPDAMLRTAAPSDLER